MPDILKTDKRPKIKLISVLIVILGVGVFLYPLVSVLVNNYVSYLLTQNYTEYIEKGDIDYEAEYELAAEYNKTITNEISGTDGSTGSNDTEYESLLNGLNQGIMGYIEIPKISVKLPINHYSSAASLNNAIGHLYGTSLPVGGEGTRCVLTGHTGSPTSLLFSNLDQLETGDYVYLNVFGYKLSYKVRDIKTVLPSDGDSVAIEEGLDLLSLITCTPYGINSHRLIVTCIRVSDEEGESNYTDISFAKKVINSVDRMYIKAYIIGSAVLVTFLITRLIIKKAGKRHDKNNKENDSDDVSS